MKKVKLAFISAAAIFCFACGQNVEKEVTEMAKSAEDWIKQQETLYSTNRGFGTCEQIGFEFPKSKTFSYECEFKGKNVSWIAENKEDLGNCKAGNKWKISMFVAGKEYGILSEPSIIVPCREITPDFFNSVKKDISEETKIEQAVADSLAALQKFLEETEKNPSLAIAEMEREAEVWIQDYSQQSANPYKAMESKYFTYRAKIGAKQQIDNWIVISGYSWTATSKMKMGDCPAGSIWEISKRARAVHHCGWSELDYGDVNNKVPRGCEAIMPEIITNHKGVPNEQSDNDYC